MNPYTDITKWKKNFGDDILKEKSDKTDYFPFAKKVWDQIITLNNFQKDFILSNEIDLSPG